MTSARLRFLRRMTALSRILSRRPRTRPCCLVNANFRLLWAARWAPLCLFFDPISDPASKAMGTHARHTSTFMEMVSPQLLVFLVITSGAFTIEWFALWSSLFDQRGCSSKVGIRAHARTLSVNVSRSGMRLMRRISASFKESSLTWLSMHADVSTVELSLTIPWTIA